MDLKIISVCFPLPIHVLTVQERAVKVSVSLIAWRDAVPSQKLRPGGLPPQSQSSSAPDVLPGSITLRNYQQQLTREFTVFSSRPALFLRAIFNVFICTEQSHAPARILLSSQPHLTFRLTHPSGFTHMCTDEQSL